MSGNLRRRRGADGANLAEPLLGDAADGSAPVDVAHDKQIIVHTPFQIEDFVRFVVLRWQSFLSTLTNFLSALLGFAPVSLTVQQAQQVEALKQQLEVRYDAANPQHADMLRQLWGLAFPGQDPPPTVKSATWKDMGWQGEDPGTDFRGAGVAGLSHLLYLGTSYPSLWHSLRHKTQGTRAEWEYPFAVAGLNLTFMLGDLLALHDKTGKGPAGCAAGRGFLALVKAEGDRAFEEVYVTTFALLDRVWLERKASYMQFNEVLKVVRGRVDQALGRHPATIASLQAALGLPRL